MGKHRSFIDKHKATTYNLIYRNAEASGGDSASQQREWTEASRGVGIGRPDMEATNQQVDGTVRRPAHPLSWLTEEEELDALSEERRREVIELGLPDDGYDYMKHMRVLGKGKASLEAPAEQDAGPSVFVPAGHMDRPGEDCRHYDARNLRLHQPAHDEAQAAEVAGGVSAFSRELARLHKTNQSEVADLEQLMGQMEAQEGSADGDAGLGDLLDDFVLQATEAPEGPPELPSQPTARSAEEALPPGQPALHEEGWGSDSDAEDGDSAASPEAASSEGLRGTAGSRAGSEAGSRAMQRQGSIASTYWRPERTDRKEMLAAIDERFEQLALQYDSDEIGELDDMGEDGMGGAAELQQYDGVLSAFLEKHGPVQGSVDAADDPLAAAAIAGAKAALRREEQREAAEAEDPHREIEFVEAPDMREQWDCESVRSMSSNIYNHPGQISEPAARQRSSIKLSNKTGLPVMPWQNGSQSIRSLKPAAAQQEQPSAAVAQPRARDETAEQRKGRKQAVKEAQRQARENKKQLKMIFKEEGVKQQRRSVGISASVVPLS